MSGPLHGFRIVELAAIGPVPFAGALLADLGADVVRVDRVPVLGREPDPPPRFDFYNRNKRSVAFDLKQPAGVQAVLNMVRKADVLLEGMRPGVTDRLGVGPDACLAANPRLVYGRMTGWGQQGPLAQEAGHDINYLALTGALACIGEPGRPPSPPLNLVADLGGGAMYLAVGVLAAAMSARVSGRGQVVDAAMIEGASMLAAPIHAFMAAGLWSDRRGANLLDSGAPFYDTYETADGRHVAVGCLEPRFFAEFSNLLPLSEHFVRGQYDKALWPEMRAVIAGRFRQKTRDDWAGLFEGTDACVAPVLSLTEARNHPHISARHAFVKTGAFERPAPAPRFSGSQPSLAATPVDEDQRPQIVLARFGFSADEVKALVKSGLIGQ